MPPDLTTFIQEKKRNASWLIPGAILVSGLILSITLYQYRVHSSVVAQKGDIMLMRPVGANDHIIGSPSAPIKLVEYSDIDSSYAKTFQSTMEQIMTEYAASGNVAWVYRHLPLIDQHPYSEQHAEAAECIASLGGPNIFWRFISALNAQAPNSLQFNPKGYAEVVTALGILPESFNDCMNNHTFQKRVADDFKNALDMGAGGSPYTVLIAPNQKPVAIDGAIPYASMKKILDDAIAKLPK